MYNVQYNLKGKNEAETGILIVEKKLYFARLCSTSMTVAVTRRPPPLPAQCGKPINIETGRKG